MLIKKVKQIIPVVAKVVQSLTSNSETDVPSVKAVNEALATQDLTSEITLIDGITYNECVMKRCGDVINLALAITFATEQTADEVTIAKIPAKYVKNIKRDVFIGSNRTLLYGYIGTSGDVIVTKPNSTWVGTNMTWII